MSGSFQVGSSRVPISVEGSGPLIVFSYVLGAVAWGKLDVLKRSCTVAVLDWLEADPPVEPMVHMKHEWFPAFVTSAGFDSGALCTWSMGSPAAVRYATTHPAQLSSVILVDPAGFGTAPQRGLSDLPGIFSAKIAKGPTRALVRTMWRHWVFSKTLDTAPLEDAHLRFLKMPGSFKAGPGRSGGIKRGERGLGARPSMLQSLLPEVEKIQVPTLVLTGRHSEVLGSELGERVVSALTSGTLSIFENSSHAVHLEEPDRFQEVVSEFMNPKTS